MSDTPEVGIELSDESKSLLKKTLPSIGEDVKLRKERREKQKKDKKEVFYLKDNEYTYEEAKAVCKAHGAKLASYQDIESAYKSGAEWGQYGWSDGQNAYFPTQQSTYDKMQKTPGHENDRGRPGVNGGFIDNPNVQFGVNCYGKKPKINTESATYMADIQPFPKTKEEKKFDKQVEFWKKRTPDMIIAPFNAGQYSK